MSETTELIWQFWCDYCARHGGLSPTYREVMAATGVSSTSVVQHHVRKLVKKGRLERVSERRYTVVGAEWCAPSGS